MELRDYLRVLRKQWILIVALVLVGIVAAAGYSLLVTPQYQASAKVFVSTQASDNVADLVQGNSFTQQRVQTYADLVNTPVVLAPVAARLGLKMTPDELSTHISASSPVNTTIIEITATSTKANQSAWIANQTAASLAKTVQTLETPNSKGAVSPVKLTRVQVADIPESPASPKVWLNVLLGALIGLAVGVAIALMRETLDTRVRNERDVQQITEAPIVGGIVYDGKAASRPLIVQVDPRGARAESFRTLRTNLQFLDVGADARTFVISSSVENEGKTTTGLNLAIALSDAGNRVLVIDADLRQPRIAHYLGIEGAVGLTDVLIGRAELTDVVQPWGKTSLSALPAGSVPPNPSELLGSQAMASLIQRVEGMYDYVLFDSPPLLPVTDAAVLGKTVGNTLLVVAASRTRKAQLKGSVSALANVGARLAGIIITMLPTKGPDAYGYGLYGYSGYGYGYSTEAAETPVTPAAKQPGGDRYAGRRER
ncbi:polysaccharide biosynthesis tyrosine autokinase [Planctomonas sp. JC2975]|uniref:polysaccharide biosynthesis tyrosine autokinase n=1 Tax=Planctomonas sp. JC2975 TaxID=2729626 RepID=UPI0014754A81|nr:polysaccharide biosynthesis tyrosine autokinase [Planctomonas sp. JC2975]NNC12951.1 polysaccharide biosynthesis tyrosine autokinase [Planctomonas sp. JC2975]